MIQHLTPLIDKTVIAIYKEISDSVQAKKINPHILSAQREDIKPLLGERLYNDIIRNRANHEELLKGGDYEFDGELYYSDGLNMVLSLYSYARYSYLGHVTDTPFGQVEKLNPNASSPITEQSRKSIFIENRKEALGCWKSVEDYLNRTNYNLFRDNCACDSGETGGGFMNFEIITG